MCFALVKMPVILATAPVPMAAVAPAPAQPPKGNDNVGAIQFLPGTAVLIDATTLPVTVYVPTSPPLPLIPN
jgi:hypothetical protein